MITKHLLVVTFCMGFITILISNTGLAFAVMCTPQYNAGYTAACSDAKSGLRIWEYDGFIWEGFYQNRLENFTLHPNTANNTEWMQGFEDSIINTHSCPDPKYG